MIPRENLQRPTDFEREAVAKLRSVSVRAADFSGFEDVLRDPKNSPIPHMQIERQQRSDCQGNATANGEEYRTWYCSGRRVMPQLSEIYAYNCSEYLMQPSQVGRDGGSSINSGVRVLTAGPEDLGIPAGLPLESIWPYSRYCKSASQFRQYCNGLEVETPHVTEVGDMPESFDDMMAAVAAGATGHIGTKWNVNWQAVPGAPKRVMDRMPTSGGGHATEIIWAIEVNGTWYLVVWNSHGDGYYLMSRRCYDQLTKAKWEPFGGYLLTPDRMVERYDRITQGGGYF